MGRRRPERDQAKEVFIASRGKISIRELSEQFGVSEQLLRKWKSQDQWENSIKKKRGAPPGNQNRKGNGAGKGNQNAKGHGAPKGSSNAKTHGASARPDTSNFTAAEWDEVMKAETLDSTLAALVKKRIYLEHRIEEVQGAKEEQFDTGGMDVYGKDGNRKKNLVYWEGKDERLDKLYVAHDRTVKNIVKIYDTMRTERAENTRIQLEKDRQKFQREKATGIYTVEDENDVENSTVEG